MAEKVKAHALYKYPRGKGPRKLLYVCATRLWCAEEVAREMRKANRNLRISIEPIELELNMGENNG